MRPFEPSHLYMQVRDELARRIANGELVPNNLLPNEFSLSQEMRVSIGTVRKAVEMLVGEKLVVRKQGRGTFVADPRSLQFRSKFDRIRNSDGGVIGWKIRYAQVEVRPATANEIRVLRLTEGDRIIALRRTREVHGKVGKWEYSRLPQALFGDVDDWDGQEMVENVAFAHGLQITSWNERVTLTRAPDEAAQALDVKADVPVMRLERLLYDRANRPLEWRIAYCDMTDRQYQLPSPSDGAEQSKNIGPMFPEPKDV